MRLRAFIVGALWVAVITIVNSFLVGFTRGCIWPFGTYGEWEYNEPFLWGLLAWPFIAFFVMSLTSRWNWLTLQEMTVISTMIQVSWLIPTVMGVSSLYLWIGAGIGMGDPFKTHLTTPGDTLPTPLFSPSTTNAEVWKIFFYGGPTPWNAWILPILFYFAYVVGMYVTSMFAVTLVRRTWIDIESLAYPTAQPVATLINYSMPSEGSRPQISRNKYLWLGFLIAFLTTPHLWLHYFVTEKIPILLYWSEVDITPLAILPWVPLNFVFESWAIGAFYFAPPSILGSYIFFNLILFFLIPPILAYAGIIDMMPTGSSYKGVWNSLLSYGTTGPIMQKNFYWFSYMNLYGFLLIGVMMGCIVWPLITHRRFIIEGIKAIWKKMPNEVEEREPIPYKWQWIILVLLIIFWGAVINVGSGGAVPFWFTPIWIIQVLVVNALWSARWSGDFGGMTNYWQNESVQHNMYNVYGYWWALSPTSPAYAGEADIASNARFNAISVLSFPMWGFANVVIANPAGKLMESYKVGDLTKTRSRHILIASLIAVISSILLSLVFGIYFANTFGIMAKWSKAGAPIHNGGWQVLVAILAARGEYVWQWWPGDVPPPATLHIAEIVGFTIAVLIFIIRAKVPRLAWLHPIGLFACTAVFPGMMWSCLVALIAKWITIRIGGTRLYMEKGTPIAIGMLAAIGVITIACAGIEAWRTLAA